MHPAWIRNVGKQSTSEQTTSVLLVYHFTLLMAGMC